MSDPSSPALDPSFVARVKGIILQPHAEWRVIDAEFATVRTLFTRYAMILAAIGPVCGLVGGVLFGGGALIGGIVAAVVGYVLSLVGVFVLGLVIDALAPSFGGVKDRVAAMKVSVYAATASWLAGVFGLIPMLGILGAILGLYSLYLLYTGLPPLMKAPQDKALGYTAVVVVAAIVIWWIIFAVVGTIIASFAISTAVISGAAFG